MIYLSKSLPKYFHSYTVLLELIILTSCLSTKTIAYQIQYDYWLDFVWE
jgi:hypothetical protein